MNADNDFKSQLSDAIGSFIGEGYNCICNSSDKSNCVCDADWSTKKEKLLERKLDIAINALIEATTDIHRFGTETSPEFQENNNLPEILSKYDDLADNLEDQNNPIEDLFS